MEKAHAKYKWVSYRDKEETFERRAWAKETNLDVVYSVYINSCLQFKAKRDEGQLRALFGSLESEYRSVEETDCTLAVESRLLELFAKQYDEFFLCMQASQQKSPHGLSNMMKRGNCYVACFDTFNTQTRAAKELFSKKYMQHGFDFKLQSILNS